MAESPTDAQERMLAEINNKWPVARFELRGTDLFVELDDGDECLIASDGEIIHKTWRD